MILGKLVLKRVCPMTRDKEGSSMTFKHEFLFYSCGDFL
jgi:hypothetical protein